MIPGHASLTSLNGPAFHAMTLASWRTTKVAGSTGTARHRGSTGIMMAATIVPKAPLLGPVLAQRLAALPACSPASACWPSPALGLLSRQGGLLPPRPSPLQAVPPAA